MKKIREMKRITLLTMVLVLIISVIPANASSKKLSVQFYQTVPSSMTVKVDKSKYIEKVYRYKIDYEGKVTIIGILKSIGKIKRTTLLPVSVKWVSSNKKVAKVNSRGKITGVKKGTAYIYPLPKGVHTYKVKGRFITYTGRDFRGNVKMFGGTGVKVKVKK